MSEFLYPLDVTGAALSNRVRGEFQTLSPPTQSDNFHFIIPKAGPYYRNTLKIRHVSTNRELKMGIDWEPGHYFHSASYETESVKGGIYQSILFLDRTLSGQIHLEEYFVLGGHWSLDENKILEILSNRLVDPRSITYEQVSGKPEVFPPIEHMHPAGDLVGMREQTEATYQIAAAIRERTGALPPELAILLENYYTRSQVDVITSDLANELLSGVAGPELERILQQVAAEMLGNYYTKGQIDQFVSNLQSIFINYYTRVEIDALIDDFVTTGELSSALSIFIEKSVYNNKISEIEGRLIPFSRIDGIENDLGTLDNKYRVISTDLSDRIDRAEVEMQNYLRRDEYESQTSVPNIPLFSQPLASFRSNSPDHPSSFLFEIENIVIENGKIKNANLVVTEIGILSIVPVLPTGMEQGAYETNPVNIAVDVLDLLRSELGDSSLEWENGSDYTTGFVISATVAVDENMTDYEINYLLENLNLHPDNILEESHNGKLSPTSENKIILGRVYLEGGLPKVDYYRNECHKSNIDRREVKITGADHIGPEPIVVYLDHLNGHRDVSVITSVKLTTSSGELVPIAGFDHDYIPRVLNKLTIFKNKLDMSDMVDKELTLTVSTNNVAIGK